VSKTIECKLTGNNVKDDINVVVSYVIRLLKALVGELEQQKSKRSRMG
ncbi:11192_t:CDS:1, partial [Funneliformis mosseae]